MQKNFLVFAEGDGAGVPPQGTPSAAGSVTTVVTPPAPPQDAEKTEIELVRAKYETDLRQLKSTLQRNEAQLNQRLQQRERQFKEELDRVRRASMDADTLKIYEAEYAKSSLTELEQQYQEAQVQLQQERALRDTISLFAQEGIPVEILLKASENGLDGVTTAAWNYLMDDNKALRTSVKTTTPPIKDVLPAPPVAPATAIETAVPFTGPKWPELETKYGSREIVYSLVEAGRLPAAIIPPEG